MKELILVRHAKSSWDDASLKDFDRPLNDRGKKDVLTMSQRLADRHVSPDLVVASPAARTKATAKVFVKALGIDFNTVIFNPSLYQAPAAEFTRVIKNFPNIYQSALMFTHNTGLTDFANELTNVHIDNIPTCGIFAVKIDTDSWKNFMKAEKQFWFFDYPKLHV